MEIFKASQQWSTRPPDERFADLQSLYDATKAYADTAKTAEAPYDALRVEARETDVQLVGKTNIPARFTHWAFGQLCRLVGAPADYLRELPPTLAAQNVNYGLAHRVANQTRNGLAQLLFHENSGLLLRAITSDRYERIWNWEIAERLLGLQEMGWQPAKPDLRFDGGDPEECQVCGGSGGVIGADRSNLCSTCKGTGKALPALYASDHDMFAFVRNRQIAVAESGSDHPLQKGIIVENSEVGAAALKLTRFLYRVMCGNHIIWDASEVSEISLRHVGSVRQRFNVYSAAIRHYAEESVSDLEAQIKHAQQTTIAATKEEVLDALFGKRQVGLSRKTLEAGFDAVEPEQDGDPKTVWGIVQGLTRHSQTVPYADKRTEVDKAAGRILKIAF